jgi:hypothetical protein
MLSLFLDTSRPERRSLDRSAHGRYGTVWALLTVTCDSSLYDFIESGRADSFLGVQFVFRIARPVR